MAYGRVNVGGGKKTEIEIINKSISLSAAIATEISSIDSNTILMTLMANSNTKISIALGDVNSYYLYLNDFEILKDYITDILDFSIFKSDNKFVYSLTYKSGPSIIRRKMDSVTSLSSKISFRIRPSERSNANLNFSKYTSY